MPRSMNPRVQMEEARALGHTVTVERKDFPDWSTEPPIFWINCTCGYRSTRRRSEKAAVGGVIWHIGKVLGEHDAQHAKEMRRNPPLPRQASGL